MTVFLTLVLAAGMELRLGAAETTNQPPASAGMEWPNAPAPDVRARTDELRQFYLKPPPSGGGVFTGWSRTGRAQTADSASDIVLKDAGADPEEAWMDRIERRLDEAGLGLSTTSLRRRPTLVDRGLEAVFAPEPIRLGRVNLGFSPYTAIKRRNPFCLLSPIPLSLSW